MLPVLTASRTYPVMRQSMLFAPFSIIRLTLPSRSAHPQQLSDGSCSPQRIPNACHHPGHRLAEAAGCVIVLHELYPACRPWAQGGSR